MKLGLEMLLILAYKSPSLFCRLVLFLVFEGFEHRKTVSLPINTLSAAQIIYKK